MSAIDRTVADQLAEVLPRKEFLRLLETFVADLGRLARECVAAAEAADPATLQRAAHSLAGAAAGIGAHSLEAAARAAMAGAPGGESDATLVGRIRDEADRTLAELAAMADRPAA